jgi:hypothetical protein
VILIPQKQSREVGRFPEITKLKSQISNCAPHAFPVPCWPLRSFMETKPSGLSFFARLGMAFSCFGRLLGSSDFAQTVAPLLDGTIAKPSTAKPEPVRPVAVAAAPVAPRPDTSGLTVLTLLQREGRLIDFLQEDVAAFSDADIGAAARVVHAGSRKVLAQYLTLEPVLKEADGSTVSIPTGFNAQLIRLTGQVAGQPPYRGTLKHHGWVATDVRFPAVSDALDARVIAPAEVEL